MMSKRPTWGNVFWVVILAVSLAFGALTTTRNVALINSTINSTPIGGSVPSTGNFTALSSTGTLSAAGLSTLAAVTASGLTTDAGGLNIGTGIRNTGLGVKHVRVTGCTTPAVVNGVCNTTVPWPGSPWPDINYTPICSAMPISGGANAVVVSIGNPTTTNIVVATGNQGGNTSATTSTIQCIAFHDN